jgi:hypothetical protein
MKGNGHLLSILKGKNSIILESSRKCTIDLLGIKTNAFRILDHGNRKRNENGNGTERNVQII